MTKLLCRNTFYKYIIGSLLSCLILVFFLSSDSKVLAETQPTNEHIFDNAQLLSTKAYHTLNEMCIEYTSKNDTVFIILTHNDSQAVDGEIYLENFYDSMVYGDCVLVLVDMYHRDVIVQAYGDTKYLIDNAKAKAITEKMSPLLSKEDYLSAFKTFLKTSDQYMNAVPWTQNPLLHLVLALAVGGITVGIMAYNSGGKTTTNSQTYLNPSNSGLVGRRDRYIYTKVTKVPRPKENRGGSGGGFKVSSGGHSHSSGRSKF